MVAVYFLVQAGLARVRGASLRPREAGGIEIWSCTLIRASMRRDRNGVKEIGDSGPLIPTDQPIQCAASHPSRWIMAEWREFKQLGYAGVECGGRTCILHAFSSEHLTSFLPSRRDERC